MGAKKPESEDQLCLDCCSHTTSVGVTHRLVQNAGSQASPSPPQSALWSSTPSEAAKHSTAFIFLLLLLCVCAYGCPRACRGSESNSVGGVSSLPIPRGFHVARLQVPTCMPGVREQFCRRSQLSSNSTWVPRCQAWQQAPFSFEPSHWPSTPQLKT